MAAMKPMCLMGVWACLAFSVNAGELDRERLWTGINGKAFRGTFHQTSPDGTKVEFLSIEGRIITVAIGNLIESDRNLIRNPTSPTAPSAAPTAADPAAFKAIGALDRSLMPGLDPRKFGGSTEEAIVDALWISLLWWNQAGILEIPKKGDFDRKAEWLHKRLSRLIATGGRSSASAQDAKAGVEQYFVDELKDVAGCRTFMETKDFSPARLGRFAQGPNAVILKMTMTYANGRDFTLSTVLESMRDDGKFAIHVFGKRFTGQLKPVAGDKDRNSKTIPVEYVLDGLEPLPEYYANNGAKIFMGNRSWNAVLVVKPFVYATPGKPAPLPADEEFASVK